MSRSLRALVVDDSRLMRELARLGLESVGGWDVLTADSGDTALAQAAAARPEVILLDVVMPGKDGPATFAELQAGAQTRDIPVILVTARDEPADRARFASLGVAGVIRKPFDVQELAGQVAGILGWGP